jgi:hypothetical protein
MRPLPLFLGLCFVRQRTCFCPSKRGRYQDYIIVMCDVSGNGVESSLLLRVFCGLPTAASANKYHAL